jgi:8-oxo-dGTP pyrophosphatase MutT (NUDIX family)
MVENLRQIFASRPKKIIRSQKLSKAAVLIPLFCRDNEYHILFTRRSQNVMHHKGQISFPGGKPHPSDSSPQETAIRESWEEIGVNPADIEIIGELDDTATHASHFSITPFVGLIPYPYKFTINPAEIDEIFDVPLLALMNKANVIEKQVIEDGEPTTVYFYEYQHWVIWGATARILKQLLDLIRQSTNRTQCP